MNATTYRVHSDNYRSDRLWRQKRTRSGTMMMTGGMSLSSVLLLSAALLFCQVQAWGNSNNNNNGATTYSIYGNGFTRDWLYDSTSLAIQVEGCAWGLVEDSEEVGCLQDESEDGTTNWYMMANCRRPQVVYSVYASSSGSASCNSDYFVGSVSLRLSLFLKHASGVECRSTLCFGDDELTCTCLSHYFG